MIRAIQLLRWLVRACALVLIVLGGLFWAGRALNWINLHMLVGVVLVLALWAIAICALRLRVTPVLALAALVWGAFVLVFGMVQTALLVGDAHWVVQVLHLLFGLAAVGLAETLGRRVATPHS